MSVLETRQLTRTFGAVVAANSLNVTIQRGEIVGVIGSNGAGKTTFINMVTGYLPATSGDILYEGSSVLGMKPRQITRLGLARSFQVAQLFPQLTVLDNVLMALAAAHEAQPSMRRHFETAEAVSEARRILQAFGVAHYADSEASAVPQGARKLVDIAMALVSKPRMLLLDEPTSGVSADEKFPLMDAVMAAVRQSGVTVLFVEHDMEVVERYVSRILAFYSGEIIADGPPAAVLGNPRVQELVVGKRAPAREEAFA
ncbi:ABC transporter ATP-binding protein [Variovorax paradoxus]|uniref:ABC transporter ATP-binding protein n=1 Tax=Variovorax paradoxus TaxID=34073 RepID=UPI000367CF16|nr:ABC transporter ATP-binding protein [Variovorax paradoxus]